MKDNRRALPEQVPFLSDDFIAGAASRLRREYAEACGLPETPRCILEDLVWDYLDPNERLSLDIETCLGKTPTGDKIAGRMSVLDEGGIIRIDKSIAESPMYPFTLAHEIGHWVLHRELIREWIAADPGLHIDGLPSLRRDIESPPSASSNALEWQANQFAAHLLMPADLVRAEFRRRYGTVPRSYMHQLEHSPGFVNLYPAAIDYARFLSDGAQQRCVTPLRKLFGVSRESMAVRLLSLGLA